MRMQKEMARIDDFYRLTVRDPLFAAEGLDLDNAALALDTLGEVTDEIERIYREYRFGNRLFLLRYPLTETLYPMAFLRCFLESERCRRKFVSLPTHENAEALLRSYTNTADSLAKAVREYRSAHRAALRLDHLDEDAKTSYYVGAAPVTARALFESIEQLARNADALREEVGRRKRVFLGEEKGGDAEARTDPIVYTENLPPLSSDLLSLKELYERKIFRFDVEEAYGPIAYQLLSLDSRPVFHPFFVYLGKSRRGFFRNRGFRLLLADTYFFVDLAADFHIDKETLFGPLIKEGIPYWFQPATNLYFMRDVSYYADLATIADLKRRTFLDRAAVLSQKSSLLDLLWWDGATAADMHRTHAKLFSRKKALPSFLHLFAVRSHAGLYYLPFNRSVWRLPEKLSLPGTQATSAYLPWDKVRHKTSPEQLERIFDGMRIRKEAWRSELEK